MAPADTQHWVVAAIAGAGAVWSLMRFSSSVRRDRLVEDTPLVKIRSAAQGYVKVYGNARAAAEGPESAPLSSRECVWWSYEVAERERRSDNKVEWACIERATSVAPFVLADDGGECLVGPVNAEITPSATDVWYGAAPRPPGGPPSSRVLFEASNYRYTERLLRVGDRLSVVGELRSSSELHREDETIATILHQWKQDQKMLLARFDADRDGRLNAAEWEAVRQAAAAEASATLLKSPISRISVIGQPVNGQPFLVAPMDSEHLVRREKLRAAFFLLLGIVLVAVSGWAVEQALMLARR